MLNSEKNQKTQLEYAFYRISIKLVLRIIVEYYCECKQTESQP